jgi:putative addiction module component (TIGR02574 family)
VTAQLQYQQPSEVGVDAHSQTILDAALALTEADRAVIAEQLLASLSPDTEEASADELIAELDRRLTEYTNDPNTAVPWSALKDED